MNHNTFPRSGLKAGRHFWCYWRVGFLKLKCLQILFNKLIVAQFIITLNFKQLSIKYVLDIMMISIGKRGVHIIVNALPSDSFGRIYITAVVVSLELLWFVAVKIVVLFLCQVEGLIEIHMKQHLPGKYVELLRSNAGYDSKAVFDTTKDWF